MTTFTRKPLFLMFILVVLIGLVGCMTPKARYVDASGPETVVSMGKINIQEWAMAVDTLTGSLLSSGALEKAPARPAHVAFDRIVNNTSNQVDTNLLTKKIRVSLSESGKCVIAIGIGAGGPESAIADQMSQLRAFESDGKIQTREPDFTLTGRLIEDRARADKTRQVTYVFQLTLIDTRTQVSVWEGEESIAKQGKKPVLGW